jgi:hypothetical protein
MRYPASEKLEIIRLVEGVHQCGGRWKSSAFRAPPSTAGTICVRPAAPKPCRTDTPSRIASGTASQTMFAIRSRRESLCRRLVMAAGRSWRDQVFLDE